MTDWADLFDLSERDRIDLIGRTARSGRIVGFIVEEGEKADRYLAALQERHPVRVISRGQGPVKGTVMVRVGPLMN